MSATNSVLGPRVPEEELKAHRSRYRVPTLCFLGAMLALLVSMMFPYWTLRLEAPQFPKGLEVSAYVNRLVGEQDPVTGSDNLKELDELNHYVGMPSLEDGAKLERSVSIMAIVVFAGLLLASVYVHSRWVVLLVLPALLFPFVFLADLQYWLWNYGHSLDPRAPLASAVGEFTPHLFGPSKIAQFDTNALPGIGLLLAFLASILTAVGLWYHRKAYKPLVEAVEGEVEAVDSPTDAVDEPGPQG
ncbi:MAG: hypothetical protein MUF83_21410 [Acidimicrobiales bacterium]|jgi:hypothetical protein|nr:hypothetical protein [Acidimicrobiales bacterium]